MNRLLTLSRAARLVGVSRGALQKRIKSGELGTFEGMVAPEDLLRVYPEASLEDNTILERLADIKEQAFGRRLQERMLPGAEVLAARVNELGKELARARTLLAQHKKTGEATIERIGELEAFATEPIKSGLDALRLWLQEELDKEAVESQYTESLAVKESLLRIMSAHVRVIPSEHEFFVEGTDSLLDAGLRAGLTLNYGCSDGSCGLCKVRVLSGDIKKVRDHGFALRDDELAEGYALLCSNTAITDLLVEAPEASGPEEIPLQHIEAHVRSVEHASADTTILDLQTPPERRLRFLAGQSVEILLGDNSKDLYPVASCPCVDRTVQLHIPVGADDALSRAIRDGVRPSDTIAIEGPDGEFVLQEDSSNPLLFVAFDCGFAPIKGLIEHAMAAGAVESMHLYWIVPTDGNHYLDNLCRAWADALDDFDYTPLTIDADRQTLTARRRNVAADRQEDALRTTLTRIVDDHPVLRDYDVYVAGAGPFVTAAANVLLERGLPNTRLFTHITR